MIKYTYWCDDGLIKEEYKKNKIYHSLKNILTIEGKQYEITAMFSYVNELSYHLRLASDKVEEVIQEPKDLIVEYVKDDLDRRSKLGVKKYGVTLSDSKESLSDFINHAYEEALDLSLYLRKIKQLMNNE